MNMRMMILMIIIIMKHFLRIVFVINWIGCYIVCVYGIVPLTLMNKCNTMYNRATTITAFLQPNHVISGTKLYSRNRSNSYGPDRYLNHMLKVKASDSTDAVSVHYKLNRCNYIPDTSIQIQNLYHFLQEEECEGIDTLDDDDDDDVINVVDDRTSTSTGTQIGLSIPNTIRGLYTLESYEPYDFIVAIPVVTAFQIMQTTITPTIKNKEGTQLSTTEAEAEIETETESISSIQSDVEKGIVYLLKRNDIENSSNSNKWERYFDSLPTPTNNCDKTIDFWIHNSSTQTIDKKRPDTNTTTSDIANDDNTIAIKLLNEFIPSMVNEAIERYDIIRKLAIQNNLSIDTVQFATWLVRSRMFTMIQTKSIDSTTDTTTGSNYDIGGNEKVIDDDDDDDSTTTNTTTTTTNTPMSIMQIQRTMLIPYMDMINHVSTKRANAIIQVIEGMTDDESMFCIQATKLIKYQQEICISYGTGDETTFELFSKYGFVPLDRTGYMIRYNPNDNIHINRDNNINNDIINTSFFHNEIQTYNNNTTNASNNITKVIEQDDIQLLKSLPIGSNQRTVIQLRIYVRRLYHHHLRRQQRQQTNLEEDDDIKRTTSLSSTMTTLTFLPYIRDDNDDDDTLMNEIQKTISKRF